MADVKQTDDFKNAVFDLKFGRVNDKSATFLFYALPATAREGKSSVLFKCYCLSLCVHKLKMSPVGKGQ